MDISAYQQLNIRMSSRGKRPLRNLTPADKVRAIQRIHNGETKASVSRDIGVPESTLRGWCKNEQKLRFMTRQIGNDQSTLSGMENPPEKRIKFENQTKIGNPLQKSSNALNATKLEESKNKYKNVSNISNVPNIPNIPNVLSVKDWAREPLENLHTNLNINKRNSDNNNKNELKNHHSANDTNNNDVNSKSNSQNFTRFGVPNNTIPNVADSEETNTPLLEWCKMFNASLNFLAMAAAASTMNVPQATEDNIPLMIPPQYSNPIENMVFQHLVKGTNPLMSDSYFDSEPEDLSIRSTTSTKLSSSTNSRSQSPASFESATYSDSEH